MISEEHIEQLRKLIESILDDRLSRYEIKRKTKPKPAPEQNKFAIPEWLEANRDVWDAWVEARTRAKHPPTEWAKRLAVSKLESMKSEGHNPRRLLAEAAFHNWSSFYAPKDH